MKLLKFNALVFCAYRITYDLSNSYDIDSTYIIRLPCSICLNTIQKSSETRACINVGLSISGFQIPIESYLIYALDLKPSEVSILYLPLTIYLLTFMTLHAAADMLP